CPPMAATAERDGASLCRHHRGRALSPGGRDSAHHATITHCNVRRTGVNISDSYLYSLSPRRLGSCPVAIRRRGHGPDLRLDDCAHGVSPLGIRTPTIHSRIGRHAVFRTRTVDTRSWDQLPPCG